VPKQTDKLNKRASAYLDHLTGSTDPKVREKMVEAAIGSYAKMFQAVVTNPNCAFLLVNMKTGEVVVRVVWPGEKSRPRGKKREESPGVYERKRGS
jgi:hypothetical protein